MATKNTSHARGSSAVAEEELLPVSTEIPADVKKKVAAAAKENDRSFGAQLRVIVKDWAAAQSAER